MASSRTSWGSASPLLFALLVAGCGDYAPANSGGSAGSSGQTSSGGAAGGGQAGSGGAAGGGGGQGGSSGTAGAGGQAGSGGGCSSAGQAGAGGSAGAPQLNCPDPVPSATPCGGDVIGTWVAASCPLTVTGEVNMMGLGLGCPSGQVTSGSLEVTGTFTADECGRYSDNTRTTGQQEIELPPSCLTVSGFVTTCDRVSDPFADTLGYDSVICADNEETGGCTCSATIDQPGGFGHISFLPPATGSYTTEGNSLVTTAEATDTEYSYCVAGNTMTVTLQTVSKTGTVMGPIVLQKQ